MTLASKVMIMIKKYVFPLLLLFFSTLGYAQGQQACQVEDRESGFERQRDVLGEIVKLSKENCYGRSMDPTPWISDINARLDQVDDSDISSIRPKVQAVINMIKGQLENESAVVPHRDDLRRALNLLASAPLLDDQSQLPVGLQGDDWKFDFRKNAIAIGDQRDKKSLKPLLLDGCSDKPIVWSTCEPRIREVELLLTYWGAISRTVWKFLKPFGQQALQELELLDKRWDAYYYEARPQNFLEVAFNSWRFNKQTEKQEGFLSPPDYQWIIMHPNIALEYIEDAPDGSEFQESLVLELFGRNSWSWKNQAAEMERPIGWSVIASITDRAEVEEIGWGVMFHIDHTYSFAFTDHDGDAGFLVSIDLLRFYGEWEQETRDKFDRFKGEIRDAANQ